MGPSKTGNEWFRKWPVPASSVQQPLLCLREVLWPRQRGTQVVAVLFFEGQSSLLRLAASCQVTARLTRPHIPGLASFGPFSSRKAAQANPVRTSDIAPVASLWTNQAPLTLRLPESWLSACPVLQKLGLTGGRAGHALLYSQLMVLDWWSEWRWLCLRMNGFQVSYT